MFESTGILVKGLRAFALLIALAGASGAQAETATIASDIATTTMPQAGNDLAKRVLALPPPLDPTTSQSYGCHFIQNLNWNYGGDGVGLVVGKVRWPSQTCVKADGPPAGRPILIFTHGRDMDHLDHDYLMAHLARNGFVTASIANSGTNDERARQAISYLNAMHAHWGWQDRLGDNVAFVGHSRGGEAAITAAHLLEENPNLGHEEFDVRAVVSIAPTDGGGQDGFSPKETINGLMTPAFLGIYGSRDPDVSGLPIAPWPTGPENTAFAIYDRAGAEFSSEGVQLFGTHVSKSMVFAIDATHKGFEDADQCTIGPVSSSMQCDDQRNIARAYINAFLRWHVFGQSQYRGFLDGTWRPASLVGLGIQQQFSDGLRRTIDNFEQGGWASNTIGGVVQKSAGIAVLAEDAAIDLDPASPHDTDVMRIKWGAGGVPWVRWSIPNASPWGIGPLRDWTDYDVLSLRAGQNYDDAWNVLNQAQNFHVRLYTSDGWSSKVPVGDYAELAYPDVFTLNFPNDHTKSAMETIRVPLSAFANANLSNVSWVALYFDVPGHASGSILIDSLELAQ